MSQLAKLCVGFSITNFMISQPPLLHLHITTITSNYPKQSISRLAVVAQQRKTSNMPPASLGDLSAESLIQVYKSLDNVKDVTALNLTSHQFYHLWLSDTIPISDAVFSRTIKSFDDARELVKIQQKSVQRKYCGSNGHYDPYRQAQERNKLMLSNFHNYLKFCEEETRLYPSERFLDPEGTRLSKSYYCVWMLILTEKDAFAQSSCLASLDSETLRLMFRLVLRKCAALFPPWTEFSAADPQRFGLGKTGGKFPVNALGKVLRTLNKHISALESAKEVGSGAENV